MGNVSKRNNEDPDASVCMRILLTVVVSGKLPKLLAHSTLDKGGTV